jgi:hypothetical protein
MTRSRAIQLWFFVVAFVVAISVVLGATGTLTTWVVLLALCLVPPAILLMLWPGAQQASIREVLGGVDRR